MHALLMRLDRWLPRRLTTRMTLSVAAIVVAAGLVTTGLINVLLVRNLRAEMMASGRALTLAVGESLANPLLEGNLVAVQEILDSAVHNNRDVVYAFAFGPHTPVVHTFSDGFPADLQRLIPAMREDPGEGTLLLTERGLVRDFAYRPLDGVPAEVHVGISEASVASTQRQVTQVVLGLTLVGCVIAAVVAYGLGQVVTAPLAELTRRVWRLSAAHLDERIDLPAGDEVGELAAAFNQMAADIQRAIRQLQTSEAGYRNLLTAAAAVGEGIALIREEGDRQGEFLFVNTAFARLAGFEPPDLVGVNVETVLHPESLQTARRAWEAIRAGRGPGPYEFTLVDRNRRTHIVETTGAILEYQGKAALAWFTRDVTERKAREEELRRRNRELTALNAVASAISELLPADELLNRALAQVLAALDLSVGCIFVREEGASARLAAAHGFAGTAFAFPNCACGEVLQTGRPTVLCGLEEACAIHRVTGLNGEPVQCHVTVPIVAGGRPLGVLTVAHSSCEKFDEAEINLLTAVGRQIGVALENARLWEEVREKERVRGELLARVIRAQEAERQRVARELHDGIGQSLNALVLGLNAVAAALEQAPDMVPTVVKRLKVSASETVRELQDVIYDLRPSVLDDLGLVRALHWSAQERLEPLGIQVQFEAPEIVHRLPSEVETALFRIGQESLSNVVKHANATAVTIRLGDDESRIWMEIMDNGQGFVVGEALRRDRVQRTGWGLLGMQERAALFGGQVSIQSEVGTGTRVYVEVPLEGGIVL